MSCRSTAINGRVPRDSAYRGPGSQPRDDEIHLAGVGSGRGAIWSARDTRVYGAVMVSWRRHPFVPFIQVGVITVPRKQMHGLMQPSALLTVWCLRLPGTGACVSGDERLPQRQGGSS